MTPMIQPNCRARFTGEDFNFIVRTLAKDRSNAVSLVQLLTESDARDEILDHEALVRAVLENPANLTISSQFYFYVLARLVLKRSGIDDRELADYVAAMLEKFSQTKQLRAPIERVEAHYISDMLIALKDATPYQTFLIRAHVGNYSLFLSGIFRENIERRQQRGAPSCEFYEGVGRCSFQVAATLEVARRYELGRLFQKLSDQFHQCRLALNRLTDELVDLGDNRFVPAFE